MRASPIPILLLALGLVGCRPNSVGRDAVASNATSSTTCCDPDDLPHIAGTFFVQTFEGQLLSYLEEGTIEAVMTYEFDPVDPLRMNIITGRNLFGDPELQPIASGDTFDLGSVEFGLSTDACEYGVVEVDLRIEITGRRQDNGRLDIVRLERSFRAVNDCVLDPGDPGDPGDPMVGGAGSGDARWIVEEIVGEPVFAFDLLEEEAPAGVPTRHPDARVAARIPARPYVEAVRHGAWIADLDAADLDRAFLGPDASFAAGSPGGPALGFASDAALPMQPGRYLLAWQVLEAPVPADEPVGEDDLEYGLFLDRTPGVPDGFRAATPFSFDPRDGTDRWLTLHRGVGDPRWRCAVRTLREGAAGEVPSAAHVVVAGAVVLWAVPLAELDARSALGLRHAAFWHDGAFGQFGAPWAADATSPVGDPLLLLDLGGTVPARGVRLAPR